jgi:hypothetical protein
MNTCECGYTEILDDDGDVVITDYNGHLRHSAHNAFAQSFSTENPSTAQALRDYVTNCQNASILN